MDHRPQSKFSKVWDLLNFWFKYLINLTIGPFLFNWKLENLILVKFKIYIILKIAKYVKKSYDLN